MGKMRTKDGRKFVAVGLRLPLEEHKAYAARAKEMGLALATYISLFLRENIIQKSL